MTGSKRAGRDETDGSIEGHGNAEPFLVPVFGKTGPVVNAKDQLVAI